MTSAQPIYSRVDSLNCKLSATAFSSSDSHLSWTFVITWRAGRLKSLTLRSGTSWQTLGERIMRWRPFPPAYLLWLEYSLLSSKCVRTSDCHFLWCWKVGPKGVVGRGWGPLLEWMLAFLGLDQLLQELVAMRKSVFVSGWLSLALSAVSWGSKIYSLTTQCPCLWATPHLEPQAKAKFISLQITQVCILMGEGCQ